MNREIVGKAVQEAIAEEWPRRDERFYRDTTSEHIEALAYAVMTRLEALDATVLERQ